MVYALTDKAYEILAQIEWHGYRLVTPIRDGAVFTSDNTGLMERAHLQRAMVTIKETIGLEVPRPPSA